jgi:hypothetical protein
MMNPTKSLFTLAIIFVIATGCRKTPVPLINVEAVSVPPAEKAYPNYFPFKVGNYWVYEEYKVEQYGVSTSMKNFDSTFVVKDTMIRGKQFWVIRTRDMVRNKIVNRVRRDSLHYITDENNKICFSSEDFSTVFSETYWFWTEPEIDTVCRYTSKMNDKDLKIITAAGTFTTSNFQTRLDFYPNYISTSVNNPRFQNVRYAKNIGIITETEDMYVSAPYLSERRLIRYKVQ